MTWHDLNGDGVRDEGEPGLAGWTSELLDPAGNVIATGTTVADDPSTPDFDEAGGAWFVGLVPGAYTVREVPQPGWEQTFPGGAGTHTFTLGPGEVVLAAFGNRPNVAPTVTVAGRATGLVGRKFVIRIDANDPSPADQKAGFKYRIDWGDGKTEEIKSPLPGSGVRVGHAYRRAGTYTVTVQAFDRDGAASKSATLTVTITTPWTDLPGVAGRDLPPATGGKNVPGGGPAAPDSEADGYEEMLAARTTRQDRSAMDALSSTQETERKPVGAALDDGAVDVLFGRGALDWLVDRIAR